MKQVKIDIGQIPEGVEVEEYPEGTLFVWSEDKPKRDPVTFELMRPEPMKKLWPEDVRRMMDEED